MTEPDIKLHETILATITSEWMTSRRVASVLGYQHEMGVDSCLRTLARKGRVRRRRASGGMATFSPYEYRALEATA